MSGHSRHSNDGVSWGSDSSTKYLSVSARHHALTSCRFMQVYHRARMWPARCDNESNNNNNIRSPSAVDGRGRKLSSGRPLPRTLSQSPISPKSLNTVEAWKIWLSSTFEAHTSATERRSTSCNDSVQQTLLFNSFQLQDIDEALWSRHDRMTTSPYPRPRSLHMARTGSFDPAEVMRQHPAEQWREGSANV